MSGIGDPTVAKRTKSPFGEALPFAADTGPLIALARVEKLQLLPRLLGNGVIPPAVHREARTESDLPGAARIADALEEGWLRVAPLTDDTPVSGLLRTVDVGEAEAIALCLQRQARLLLIDDAKGRKVAHRAGISVVGVAGVLLAAKSKGLLVAVGPVLDDLARIGYRLSHQLMDEVRRRAHE